MFFSIFGVDECFCEEFGFLSFVCVFVGSVRVLFEVVFVLEEVGGFFLVVVSRGDGYYRYRGVGGEGFAVDFGGFARGKGLVVS